MDGNAVLHGLRWANTDFLLCKTLSLSGPLFPHHLTGVTQMPDFLTLGKVLCRQWARVCGVLEELRGHLCLHTSCSWQPLGRQGEAPRLGNARGHWQVCQALSTRPKPCPSTPCDLHFLWGGGNGAGHGSYA